MLFILLCLLLATICGQFIEGSLVMANNQESVKIYNLLRDSRDTNLICSPLSVSTVLSLTLAGAKGKTAKEISEGLNYSDLSQAEIDKGYHNLLLKVIGSKDYDLILANSIWVAKKALVLQNYKNLARNDYHAEIGSLNQSKSANQINSWIKEKSKGLFPNVFKSLGSNVLMVLVNAVYFKGPWLTLFQLSDTKEKVFYKKNGKPAKKLVPQMHVTSRFRYVNSTHLRAQVVELPYKGENVSMVVVLPHSKTGLEALEEKLKFIDLALTIFQLSYENVNLSIPKFKIESDFELEGPIRKLGVKKAFRKSADFSGITISTKLRLSEARQKSIIEVDESGTTAAVVTTLFSVTGIKVPPRTVQFTANHPFLFIIRHIVSDSILLMGRYVKP